MTGGGAAELAQAEQLGYLLGIARTERGELTVQPSCMRTARRTAGERLPEPQPYLKPSYSRTAAVL